MTVDTSRFIVLEGLDGAGTTTQTARLHEYLTSQGRSSFLTREPTDGAIGVFTRDLLSGGQPPTPSQRVLGLLFAADRLTHGAQIARALSDGRDVVCDRYILSSMAYQTLDPAITAEWVIEANRGCALPHLTFLLDVPVDVCLERISGRSADRTIYERKDRLETIDGNYRRLASLYEQYYGRLITIDGTGSPAEVHSAIVAGL
jgi:dTMP kinase